MMNDITSPIVPVQDTIENPGEAPTVSSSVEIWTDGACRGNPGPGGWAAIIRTADGINQLTGSKRNTTNNRMELTAAIEALRSLNGPCEVTLRSDSQYLIRGMNEWLPAWYLAGWKTSSGKLVHNQALWATLRFLNEDHRVTWLWVKGHAEDPMNVQVDRMAVAASNRAAAAAVTF